MSYENYYEYNGNVDLDDQTLFDYINQQIEVQKAMDNVVPAKPEIFGLAAEPFEADVKKSEDTASSDENENEIANEQSNKWSLHYLIKWIILLMLILLAIYFLFGIRKECGIKYEHNNVVDSVTPTVGSEFRAIFVK